MLRAENVSYNIKDKFLVKDVTLGFEKNKFKVIMGQNGAGKSTLLRMLAGSLKPNAGNIFLNDKPLREFSELSLALMRAVLSQHYDITFPISVFDIVLMGRYPHFKNVPAKKDINICNESLELLGMKEFTGREYSTLSGGEAQKVQMSRVLSQIWDSENQRILFLDEPVSNLDLHYQHQILKIAKAHTEKNTLVIAVLHDINLAIQYADEIIFMKHGKIIESIQKFSNLTAEIVKYIFEIDSEIITNPFTGKPVILFK